MDGNASVLIGVLLALSSNGVELVGHWLPGLDFAGLKDDSRVAEDEVDGACDVALPVELTVGVGV